MKNARVKISRFFFKIFLNFQNFFKSFSEFQNLFLNSEIFMKFFSHVQKFLKNFSGYFYFNCGSGSSAHSLLTYEKSCFQVPGQTGIFTFHIVQIPARPKQGFPHLLRPAVHYRKDPPPN
jgi:hypothetical protein